VDFEISYFLKNRKK